MHELGNSAAQVWGLVWSYCQMPRGVCIASVTTMADRLGLSASSVRRALALLVRFHYLRDLSPDLRNRPHVYVTTRQ